MKKIRIDNEIVEKKLGIPPDYQYNAIRNSNFLQANWHSNKFTALDYCLDINDSISVLDLGTGSGNFELIFGKKVKGITAVDYHKEALNFLKSKLGENGIKNVKLVHSDIRELNKITTLGKYDLIILIDVIEHIRIYEAYDVIKYFKKLIKPGGSVCIVTPNYHSLWILIEKVLDKLTIVPHFSGEQHLAKYYPENLIELFRKNGFSETKVTSFNLFSYIAPFKSLSALLCKLELWSNMKFGNLLMGVFTLDK